MLSVLEDLVVLHHPARTGEQLPIALKGLEWQTCLRRISLVHKSNSASLVPTVPATKDQIELRERVSNKE